MSCDWSDIFEILIEVYGETLDALHKCISSQEDKVLIKRLRNRLLIYKNYAREHLLVLQDYCAPYEDYLDESYSFSESLFSKENLFIIFLICEYLKLYIKNIQEFLIFMEIFEKKNLPIYIKRFKDFYETKHRPLILKSLPENKSLIEYLNNVLSDFK